MIDCIAGASHRRPSARRHRRSGQQPRTHPRSGTARTDRFQSTVRQLTRMPAAPTSEAMNRKRARAQQRERPPSRQPGAHGGTGGSDGSRRVSRASEVGTGPGRMPPAPRRGPAPGARRKACRVRAVGQEAAQNQRQRWSQDIGAGDGGHAKSGNGGYADQVRGRDTRRGRRLRGGPPHGVRLQRQPVGGRHGELHAVGVPALTTTEPVRNAAGVKSSAGSGTSAGVSYAKTAAETPARRPAARARLPSRPRGPGAKHRRTGAAPRPRCRRGS